MTLKPTAFATAGSHWVTTLGTNGGSAWPNSMLYWPAGVTAGWSGTLLSRWQKMTTMLGRSPDGLRDYFMLSDVVSTTGVSGSAGSYGFISADHRTIMNGGGFLVASFMLTNGGGGSDTFTDVTSKSHDADLDKLILNIKRWHDDTGNTAPVKKIILCYHHEPSNDKAAGTAADFKKAFQYVVNYLASNPNKIKSTSTGSTGGIGPGQTYDCVEWAYIDIATAFSSGSFYPGDDYVTWAFADPYNWGGGLVTPAGANGHIPTTGDSVLVVSNGQNTSGHYSDAWRDPVQICQPLLNWSDSHPTINLGLTELGASGDIKQFTVNGSFVLTSTAVAGSGVPGKLTEWVSQLVRAFSGLASAGGVVADNAFTADTRMRRIKIVTWWNSQAQGPRWINQMPVANGGTVPGVGLPGGVTTADVLNAFKTVVADPYFSGAASTGPTITDFSVNPIDGSVDQASWSVTVTMGTSLTGTYSMNPQDVAVAGGSPAATQTGSLTVASGVGTASGTITYSGDGSYTPTIVVTDGNSLTASTSDPVTVTGGATGSVVLPRTQLTQWSGGNIENVRTLGRPRFNNSNSWIETLATRWNQIVLRGDSASWTSFPTNVTSYMATGTASRYWNVDFTGYTKIKAAVSINTALANAKLVPIYSIDGGTTWKCFDSAGTAGTTVTFAAAGPLTGPVVSAGTVGPALGASSNIPIEAQTAILLTFAGYGGDNTSTVQPNRLTVSVN